MAVAGVVSGKVSNGHGEGHGERLALFCPGGCVLLRGGRPGRDAGAFLTQEQPAAGAGEEDLAVSAVFSKMPAQAGSQTPGSRSQAG